MFVAGEIPEIWNVAFAARPFPGIAALNPGYWIASISQLWAPYLVAWVEQRDTRGRSYLDREVVPVISTLPPG